MLRDYSSYDIPFCKPVLKRFRWLQRLPFLPSYSSNEQRTLSDWDSNVYSSSARNPPDKYTYGTPIFLKPVFLIIQAQHGATRDSKLVPNSDFEKYNGQEVLHGASDHCNAHHWRRSCSPTVQTVSWRTPTVNPSGHRATPRASRGFMRQLVQHLHGCFPFSHNGAGLSQKRAQTLFNSVIKVKSQLRLVLFLPKRVWRLNYKLQFFITQGVWSKSCDDLK